MLVPSQPETIASPDWASSAANGAVQVGVRAGLGVNIDGVTVDVSSDVRTSVRSSALLELDGTTVDIDGQITTVNGTATLRLNGGTIFLN